MVSPSEGKRRAAEGAGGLSPARSADLARLWGLVAEAQAVLGRRQRYYLASEAEVLVGDQLSLIGLLQDWVPINVAEAEELTRTLRAYIGADPEGPRDASAAALRVCVRAMILSRARAQTPFPSPG